MNKIDYWAQLLRDDTVKVSPPFTTQQELRRWVSANKQPGDLVAAWRREANDSGFKDSSLTEPDPPLPTAESRQRLATLTAEVHGAVDGARRKDRMTRRPARDAVQRGREARERLEQAGREMHPAGRELAPEQSPPSDA